MQIYHSKSNILVDKNFKNIDNILEITAVNIRINNEKANKDFITNPNKAVL